MPVTRSRIARLVVITCVAFVTQGAWADDNSAGGETSRARTEFVTASAIVELPATYEGDLPAADGPGIRYHLDLFPDHVFFLRLTYLDRGNGAALDDIGTWSLSPDGPNLTLRGGREAPIIFAVKGDRILRKLDLEGGEINSRHSHDLTQASRFSPIEPRVRMRGMYSYMADAGLFQECSTRRKLPVAQEGDNASLESAYAKARAEPGEPLLVNLDGRIATRPRMEGSGSRDTLVVERFMKLWPGETCGAQFSTATLTNTYWKLVRLGDDPVTVMAHQREPHMILRLGEKRQVGGSTGCNRLMGSYAIDGPTLHFASLATTKMACPEGMDQEQAFQQALAAAVRWTITGEHLELFDARGGLLARFEARYME